MGGGLVWQLLASGEPQLAAAVPFYGPLPDGADFGGSKDVAVLAFYGSKDARVTGTKDAAQQALDKAGLVNELVVEHGADHAFFNDTGERYDPTAAADAWQTTCRTGSPSTSASNRSHALTVDRMGAARRSATERLRPRQDLWFALLLTVTNGFMDAHTYYVRGGVFANVQTGNVIFFAIDASERKVAAAMAHVWPILAFIVGVALAAHIKSGRVERLVPHPLRWTMTVQVVALAVIGFVPVTVAHSYVTVPIAFLAALQMGLFRNIGDLAYLPVATTGNLMRFVESGYDGFVEKQAGGVGAPAASTAR